MPSGSNGVTGGGGGSTLCKVASSRSVPRSVNQFPGDEIAAGGRNMKRAKRVNSAESISQSKKRFVGVRQRPSGRWVAEIKDTTQKIRLWLGTFDSAEEGAKAYDSAARALRGANTRTNFVAAMASCDATSKAARLIRLRQQTAAANSKVCAEKLDDAEQKLARGRKQLNTTSLLLRQDLNGGVHSQVTCTTIPPSSPARLDLIRTRPNAQPGSPQSDTAPVVQTTAENDGPKLHVVAPPQQSAITSENLSNAIYRSLNTAAESLRDVPTDAPQLQCEAADHGDQKLHPLLESCPRDATSRTDVSLCATSDKEANDNEVMFAGINSLHSTTCQDDASSALVIQSKEGVENTIINPLNSPSDPQYHVDDQLDHRNNNNPILRESGSYCFPDYMIPWPDYVLMDGLDLSCETSTTTTGVLYPEAFDFSAEAMDRDSLKDQHSYLSDDSGEFLLRGLQQHSAATQSSDFQGQCELPKSSTGGTDQVHRQSPGNTDPESDGVADCDECPSQDQALWGSMDLAPLCMVA